MFSHGEADIIEASLSQFSCTVSYKMTCVVIVCIFLTGFEDR